MNTNFFILVSSLVTSIICQRLLVNVHYSYSGRSLRCYILDLIDLRDPNLRYDLPESLKFKIRGSFDTLEKQNL